MSLTADPTDPDICRGGPDKEQVLQCKKYLILSDEERAKGFVRPVRKNYVHTVCQTSTSMNQLIAETYARDPKFYGFTYCVECKKHLPVEEFVWQGTKEKVGS